MDKKQVYQEKMKAELREWQARIDILKAKADKVKAEKQGEYHEEIKALRAKQEQLSEKLAALESAGEQGWEKAKSGVENAWNELKESVDSITRRFH